MAGTGAAALSGRRRATGGWRPWAVAATTSLLAAGLGACSSPPPPPGRTVTAFLAAWDRNDGTAMAALVDAPAPGFASAVTAITAGVGATSVTRTATPTVAHGPAATTRVTSDYRLAGVGTWTVTTTLTLVRRSGHWLVQWSPAAVDPALKAGQRLVAVPTWAPRAQILGAGGVSLTPAQDQVVVGVEGSRITDRTRLASVLQSAGATATEISSALGAAASHPTYFEPVFQLTAAAFATLGGDSSPLYTTAGTVFQHVSKRSALTGGLAAHLVGTVGPVTADQLRQLGAPYRASDLVGQSGLEAAYEKQLAGNPGATIDIVGSGGAPAGTAATFAPVAGRPVLTSVDPAVQQAAETAMAGVGGTAGLVAVRASTGEVLASVSNPAASPFDAALDGEFPPGSTFKVLTSTALIQAGLSPTSAASCPTTVTVDGETFHNAEGDSPVSDLQGAFTESCNTAFVQLATAHLQPTAFTGVAALFGLGSTPAMGLPAFGGKVPVPGDQADLAATSIGQGAVVASPLAMAEVAAAVAGGTAHATRLVSGAPDDTAAGRPLPAVVVTDLHEMMAAVVTSGTAANTGLPAGTYAKTGTAEYGSGNPLPTDAWLIGWNGDVAFAMVEQDSKGDGGPVDGPVVARFLKALPPPAG